MIKNENINPLWVKLIEWFKMRFSKEEDIISAQDAFCYSTYGYKISLDDRIKICHKQINALIKSKMKPEKNVEGDVSCCYCVYSISEDIKHCADEIFSPFKTKGFKIIHISDKLPEIEDDNLYLISWHRDRL